ncbi:fimbrial protein [Providencia vermicola]|uniref:fimbrial protein n=1 Tax=Providencia vermicola TaxID=333965 RepID=UPI002AB563A4|nr:type 1 fimbrial protein [Providencia stuartii]
MKLRLLALATLASLTLSSYSSAAVPPGSQGNGEIMFKGSVIKAPCGLAPGKDGDNQEIDMGQIADAQLTTIGYGKPKDFKINLIGCTFDPAAANEVKVNVRFDGMSTGGSNGFLGVTGEAKGVAIRLTDSSAKQVKIGANSDNYSLRTGDNSLLFSAQAVKLDGEDVVAGTYSALASFSLTYL